MKLLAPVSNLASCVKQIEAGANEIYVGGTTKAFEGFSFNARPKQKGPYGIICPEFSELREIVNFAHQHDATVMFAANTPILANDPEGTNYFETEFLKYIEEGVNAGVDSIVVADLGAAILIRQKGIKTHLTASTTIESINIEQIKFFEELGFKRVVLSYLVTLSEIEELTRLSNLEVEVFGHFGCSLYDGYCNFKHPPEEMEYARNIGIPCMNTYNLMKDGEIVKEGQFLKGSLMCSICSLPRLKMAGVHSIKMVGRELDADYTSGLTRLYANILREINQSENPLELDMEVIKRKYLDEGWLNGLCKNRLCKYIENPITMSYV
ncbi:MAG TPA: peptidase U32 family protein [Clostridia bacterium]|nr:peptidase U32 family protein [Clostridia bacterium]